MRPEAAAGAREARGRACHCPADGPRSPESPTPWRPWILTPQEAELTRSGSPLDPGGDRESPGSKGAFGFQHPVRLYLPISKRQEYLQSSGEKVLASFPVQATIHFYNDESDPDDEEQEEETQSLKLQCQEAEGRVENGPGGKGRGQLTNPGWRSEGRSGLDGVSGQHCTRSKNLAC
uniref:Protein ripply3 n=1 Tax=Canis lupus familiaris TaxID=9615 RepID=A0A8C0TD78_CANLF